MLTKTRAIVIRKTPYTDNSAVLQLFTEQSGLLSFLVQGIHGKSASSKKSGSSSQSSANVSKSALYQLSNVVEIIYHYKPGSIQRIKEISLLSGWGLASTPLHDQVRWFVLEILQLALQHEQPEQDLFEVAASVFERLNAGEKHVNNLIITTMLQFSEAMGFQLEMSEETRSLGFDIQSGSAAGRISTPATTITPAEMQVLQSLIQDSTSTQGNAEIRKSLFQKLAQFLSLHGLHGKPLLSLEILREI